MRKLATIRKISDIQPIEGADVIALASIDGWKSIIRKDDFQIGDLVIYCEIDSFLPVRPEFEFLRKSCYKKLPDGSEGFRIKTMKLKKTLSQGIVFDLNILPYNAFFVELGADVSDILGITLYEKPIYYKTYALHKGNFPYFIPKTDEERIQNLPGLLTEHHLSPFIVTEKLDGTSFTCYLKDGEFGIADRNWELKLDNENLFTSMVKKYDLESKLKRYGKNIALQGEIIGYGINHNRSAYKFNDQRLYFFNAYDIDSQRRMLFPGLLVILKEIDLLSQIVPLISICPIQPDIDFVLSLAQGKSLLCDTEREGIVCRLISNPNVSFKVMNNTYLLKND